jgi:hypothetical protein
MNPTYKRLTGLRRIVMVGAVGTLFQFGGCNISEFTTSASLTLTARDLVNLLVDTVLLGPIETAIDNGVDRFFDELEDNED